MERQFIRGMELVTSKQGAIAGGYTTTDGVIHGFVRDPEGAITTFDGLGAGTTKGNGSVGEMINDAGTIPGVSLDNNGLNHAFIRYSDGTFVTFGVTGAGTAPGQGTLATAANVAGTTAGTYYDANGVSHASFAPGTGVSPPLTCRVKGLAPAKESQRLTRSMRGGAVVGWYVDSIITARTTASSSASEVRTTEAQVNSINHGAASWRTGSPAVKSMRRS